MVANFVIGHEYAVRAAALATEDQVVRSVLLGLIEESEEEALSALQRSCWAEDLHADPQLQRQALRASLSRIYPDASGGTVESE